MKLLMIIMFGVSVGIAVRFLIPLELRHRHVKLLEEYKSLQNRYEDVIVFKQDKCLRSFDAGYMTGYYKRDPIKDRVNMCGEVK